MLDKVHQIIVALNQSNICYCNWKGTAKIYEGLNGESDIDILVAKENALEIEELLQKEGFVQAKTQWRFRFKDVYDWIGFDDKTGKLLHIHLHFRIIAGHPYTMEYTLPWDKSVLAERILSDCGIYTISPEWELLLFLVRIGLEYPNKKISSETKGLNLKAGKELEYLQTHINWRKYDTILKKTYPLKVRELMQISKKQTILEADCIYLKEMFVQMFGGKEYSIFYKYISSMKGCIDRILTKHSGNFYWMPRNKKLDNGLMVAFLGQDGSGKSTVTKEIEQWLDWKLEVKRFYLGSGEEYYNPWRRRLLKATNKYRFPIVRIVRYWLYFSYLLDSSRYVLKTITQAKRFAKNGGIALLDRYPQIEFKGINDGPKIRTMLMDRVPKGFRWLGTHYARMEELNLKKAVNIAPSLVYKLVLSTEESLCRKPFENREMVERKHEIIKALQFPYSEVVTIDAEQNFDKEINEIKQILWKKILK